MFQTRRRRLTLIIMGGSMYLLLVILDVRASFTTLLGPALPARMGFSALVGLSFLTVGSLVWLYSSERRVSSVLFGFCLCAACTFGVETSAKAGDAFFSEVGSTSSSIALALLAVLLLLFPHNVLASSARHARVFRGLLGLVLGLCAVSIGGTLLYFFSGVSNPLWLNDLIYCYTLLSLVSSTLAIGLSYRGASNLRGRQQVRLLLLGIIAAVVPFIVLTLLPQLLQVQSQFVMDSQFSTVTFWVFPAALGYALVRYQILVFDGLIRTAIVACVGTVCVFLLAALLVTYSPSLLPHAVPAQVGLLVTILGTLGSYLWWVTRTKMERLIFSEPQYYRSLLNQSAYLAREYRDVATVAASILEAVVEAFDPSAPCLLILDEGVGCFRPSPVLSAGSKQKKILAHLFERITPVEGPKKVADWLDAAHPRLGRLAAAKRPLLLSELCTDQQTDVSLLKIRPTTQADGTDPLLAAVRVHERMIGILVLGPRGDTQVYAGPDFEALEFILSRYGPALEAARLSTLDAQYAALVMKIFQGMPQKTVDQDVSHTVAKAIASATASCTEIWLTDEEEGKQVLRLGVRVGTGPPLLAGDQVAFDQLRDGGRNTCFASWPGTLHWVDLDPLMKRVGFASDTAGEVPRHSFPFAWLPLLYGDHMLGVLILLYQGPHVFSSREQHLLQLCVQQYAGLFKQAQIIHCLQAAARRQHERECVQEQSVLEATAALYRPLTTFEGYVDLLQNFGPSLPPDVRKECLERAQRASENLLLVVNGMIQRGFMEQQWYSDAKERE